MRASNEIMPDRRLGNILVGSNKLNSQDVEKVTQFQQKKGLRFGEAALKLKLVREDDIEYAIASQFSYNYLKPKQGGYSKELIAAYTPFEPQVELFREVRTLLSLHSLNNVFSIISPSRSEGRSYIAANLAVVFSQIGEKTLLIDADLRHARQHEIFNVGNKTGLSLLLNNQKQDDCIHKLTYFSSLFLLPAGPKPPNPLELFGSKIFSELLIKYASQYSAIIIDTPAGMYTDILTMTKFDSKVIVMRQNKSKIQELRNFIRKLKNVGQCISGTILNKG